MSVKQDVVNLLVNINGDSAKNKLNDLRKSAADLREAMKGMKKDSDDYIAASAKLSTVKTDMEALKKEIGLTSLSQKELNAELRRLNALKSAVAPFSKEFNQLQKQINAVKGRLAEVRSGTEGFRGVLAQMVPEVRGFGAVMLAAFAFQAIRQNITGFIKDLASMSNQLSDIQRVTGMTKVQVNQLDSALKGLDTGTGVQQLRDLAIVAGKLGVANKDILSFVEATDKLVVALGDELGDADAITTNLGKIINVFDSEGGITGDKLLHIGNAIVDLANKGVASGGYIVDFTQRLSGIAKAAGVALPAVIGLAAGFEESGLRVESSSTALQNLLGLMGKNVAEFAKVAGIDLQTFAKTVREDPVEALIELSQGALKNKQGFAELAPVFKDLEANGIRVQQVLATLGTKGDFFREKIQDAGVSLKETGEITDAFALKNDNLSANLSKLGKEFSNSLLTSGMVKFFNDVTKSIISFVQAIKRLPEYLEQNKGAVLLLVTGIVLLKRELIASALAMIRNTAAQAANIIATKAVAAAAVIAGTSTAAYGVVVDLLTGKITLSTAVTRLWFITTKSGLAILGGFVTVIGAALLIFGNTEKAIDGLTVKQRAYNEINKKSTDSTVEQKEKIKQLIAVINDETVAKENRQRALNELIALNPKYLNGLTLENIKTQEGIGLINDYVGALDRLAKAKAIVDVKADLMKQQIQAKLEADNASNDALKASQDNGFFSGVANGLKDIVGMGAFSADEDAQKKLKDVNRQLEAISGIESDEQKELQRQLTIRTKILSETKKGTKEYDYAAKKLDEVKDQLNVFTPGVYGTSAKPSGGTGDSGNYTPASTTGKGGANHQKIKNAGNAFVREMKDLQDKLNANEISQNEKQIVAVEQKYAKFLAEAKKYAIDELAEAKKLGINELEIEKMKQQELQQLFEEQFQKRSEDEYSQSLKNTKDYYDKKRDAANKDYLDGILNEKAYKKQIIQIDEDEKSQKALNAKEYAQTSKKAADDLVKYNKEASEKQVKDKIAADDKAEADRQKKAKLQQREALEMAHSKLAVAELTLPKGSNGLLEARKAALKAEFDYEKSNKELSNEMKLQLDQEYEANVADLERQAQTERFERLKERVETFANAMGAIFDLFNAIEERQLSKDKKANDEKKKNLQKQLDAKLISQTVFDKKTAALDEEQDKREQEARKKAAQREKVMNMFQIGMNTATAIMKTYAEFGWPLGVPMAITQGIIGAVQLAAVAATPIPEMGTGGLLRNGPKHKDSPKGLAVVNPETGNTEMLLERGEAVVSAAALENDKIYTMRGTTAQITSTLNGLAGGATWASNATFIPAWQRTPQPEINAQMVRVMATGGLVASRIASDPDQRVTSTADPVNIAGNQDLISEIKGLRGDIAKQRSTLKAYVVLKDIDKQRALYEQAQKAGGINQE